MTNALVVIPEAPETFALAESEARIGDWIDGLDDLDTLKEAQRRLDALRNYYERGSDDATAARRLGLRTERRMGMLVPPMPPEESGARRGVTDGYASSDAERMALSRARALAAVPQETFDRVLEEPNPSRAKVMRASADERWDALVDKIVSPETKRRSAIDRLIAEGLGLTERFDLIEPRPTMQELGPLGPSLTRLLREATGSGKLEVVR